MFNQVLRESVVLNQNLYLYSFFSNNFGSYKQEDLFSYYEFGAVQNGCNEIVFCTCNERALS